MKWCGWVLCVLLVFSSIGTWADEGITLASQKRMVEAVVSQVVTSIKNVDPRIRTLALWHLEVKPGTSLDTTLLEDRLTAALVAADEFQRFVVIDRVGLELLASEQGIQLSQTVDRRQMREVGQRLQIDGFLYGQVSLEGGTLILDLRLMDPRRAAIVWTQRFRAKDPVLEAKQRQALEEAQRRLQLQKYAKERKSPAGAALRSLLLPGLGQFYASHTSEGISFLFLEGVGGFLWILSNMEEGRDTRLATIGVALLATNHLVGPIHAALAANRHNVRLKQKLGGDLQAWWHPQRETITLVYHRRF